MSEKNHPIAGTIFLAVAVSGIAVMATAAVRSNKYGAQEKLVEQVNSMLSLGEQGDLEGAAFQLQKLSVQHPNNTDILYNLGVALSGLERYEDAEKVFQQVLEMSPQDSEAMAERALIMKLQGRMDEALGLLEQIPVGAGKLKERLREDPRWQDVADDPRITSLRQKHGL